MQHYLQGKLEMQNSQTLNPSLPNLVGHPLPHLSELVLFTQVKGIPQSEHELDHRIHLLNLKDIFPNSMSKTNSSKNPNSSNNPSNHSSSSSHLSSIGNSMNILNPTRMM